MENIINPGWNSPKIIFTQIEAQRRFRGIAGEAEAQRFNSSRKDAKTQLANTEK